MGSAAGGLAYDRSPLLGLQVVAELLGSGEGAACGKDINWYLRERDDGSVCGGPVLPRRVALAGLEIVEVSRLVEQVACDETNHGRIAAAILTQIEDERIGVGHKAHCRGQRCATDGWIIKSV